MRFLLCLLLCFSAHASTRFECGFISYSDNAPSKRFKRCIDSCFEQWSKASGLQFERVKSDGEIKIVWTKRPLSDPIFLGYTIISINADGSILNAVISLNACHYKWHVGADFGSYPPRDGRRGNAELTGVALHEIGHALGLPHSSNQEDTMFLMIHPGSETLSEGDIQAVRSLYQ